MSQNASALVQPLSGRARADFERRATTRHPVTMEALSRPLEGQDAIWWGATVHNLSTTGIGLSLCFPFRPGTYLAIDLKGPGGRNHTVLARVIHARDQADGTWSLGCEFVKRLAESDLELMIGE
jgi:hypothetical protein